MKPQRIGRDFWIDGVTLSDGNEFWRVLEKGGGVRAATGVEVALWNRFASAKMLPRRPRWYIERTSTGHRPG